MDQDGTFYASKYQKVGEFHHSSLLGGEPVAAAGEMAVKNGVLLFLSNKSGHYRLGAEFVNQALAALRKAGVDLGTVRMSWIGTSRGCI